MKTGNEWIEIPIFIHGIMPEKCPQSHKDNYIKLLRKVNGYLVTPGERLPEENLVSVEWGWKHRAYNQQATRDEYLAKSERIIDKYIRKAAPWYKHINPIFPWRILSFIIRNIYLYAIADLFYYVSEEGKRAVRNSVFSQIKHKISSFGSEHPNGKFSLTFVTHSAGSIIAHDFLWYLYGRRSYERANEMEIEQKLKTGEFGTVGITSEGIIDLMLDERERQIKKDIEWIRKLEENGRIRIRRFYSMGSSVTPLILRYHHFSDRICEGRALDTVSIGLKYNDNDRPVKAQWLNFWDKDDFLSFPIQFLYANDTEPEVVADRYINLGYTYVHGRIWKSKKIAKAIAENWRTDCD